MSDIQRWDMFGEVGINEPVKYGMWEAVEGRYVTYDDHVAAVAAAQREGSNQGYLNGVATNVDNSFKAGVKAARDAVAAIEHWATYPTNGDKWFVWTGNPLDAIDALEKP